MTTDTEKKNKAEEKAVKNVEPPRVAVPAKKKVAPGRIVYNPNLGNYRCINNQTNKRVLTCNTLDGARREFPEYEVIQK